MLDFFYISNRPSTSDPFAHDRVAVPGDSDDDEVRSAASRALQTLRYQDDCISASRRRGYVAQVDDYVQRVHAALALQHMRRRP